MVRMRAERLETGDMSETLSRVLTKCQVPCYCRRNAHDAHDHDAPLDDLHADACGEGIFDRVS